MEEEEEAHTAVDKVKAITADEVEAEDTTTLAQAAQLREDFSMLLAPACLTKVRSRKHTKKYHNGRNWCNTLERIREKTWAANYKKKTSVNLVEPLHAPKVIARHAIREGMIRTGQAEIQTARETQRIIMEAAVTAGIDDGAPTKLVILENEIAQSNYEANVDVPIIMAESEKTQSSNKWRTYSERNDKLKIIKEKGSH